MTASAPQPSLSPAVEAAPVAGARPARPTGVTILGVLYLVAAGFAFLATVYLLFAGAVLGTFGRALSGGFFDLFAGSFVLAALVVLAFGVGALLIGLGLLRGSNGARIGAIVFAILGGLSSLSSFLRPGGRSGILALAVHVVVLWYLFQPGVKRYFSPK